VKEAAPLLLACLAVLAGACRSPGTSQDPTFGYPLPGTAQPPTGPATTGAPATGASPAASLPIAGAWARLDVAGAAPAAREDHTWTVDPDAGVAYLFGGRAGGTDFGDLWAFDLATETWSELQPAGPAPLARFGHDAAWLPGRGLVVTLGQAGSGFFDDIWLFDAANETWRKLPDAGAKPVARYGSCSGVGPDGRLWISHGFTEEGARFFDTRAYDFDTEAWDDRTPPDLQPVERCLHACWWTDDGDFVLYGGQTTGVAALGDLWLLQGSQGTPHGTWMKLEGPTLAARHLPAVARRGQLTVVVGGRDVDRKPLGDTWLLPDPGGPAIARLEVAGPPPRSGGALVYDSAGDRMLLFGGIGDAVLDDLWVLSFD
jgi:Galactose oxidase, central domain/Kelch motif